MCIYWFCSGDKNGLKAFRRTLFYLLNYQGGRALYISPCGLLLELPSGFLHVEKHSEEFCRMRINFNSLNLCVYLAIFCIFTGGHFP